MDNLVTDIFQKHYDYYGTVGVETIKQQAGQVEQVTGDYQGRVIYEVLQNAFDKVDSRIKVIVSNGNFYVANDGAKFTYRKDYDYDEGTKMRGDFQALCSISTSAKDVNKSIGNKGVGFKSVFSVSANGYADVHTLGELIGKKGKEQEHLISFRIYDTFTDVRNVPKQLGANEKDRLRDRIKKSNAYNKNKGVPGYYYPVWLEQRDKQVNSLLKDGYVTVIQVPLAAKGIEKLAELYEEIRLISFHFIALRVDSRFVTNFEFEGRPDLNFVKEMAHPADPFYFYCPVNSCAIALAHAAGIPITAPQVAISFNQTIDKEHGSGKLYNYLPTDLSSPFRMIDLHADFHTTVDRTGINFRGAIGEYNKALLEAAIELVFYVFNNWLEPDDRLKLNYRYLNIAQLTSVPGFDFFWKFIGARTEPFETFDMVRGLLRIEHYNYKTASELFARLANKYFRTGTPKSELAHNAFFSNTVQFIDHFSRHANLTYDYPREFKAQLVAELKVLDVPLIPSGTDRAFSVNDEVIYQEKWLASDESRIPDFIGLKITGYKVPDPEIRKLLDIKDVIVGSEVLKYYRQVSPAGDTRDRKEAYSEQKQRHLLRSIALLIDKPRDKVLSTHRYIGYLSVNRPNSSVDLANFSLSTVFLKIKTTDRSKCYKPAQLCLAEEVDLKFLPVLPPNISQRVFLKYLGVSYAGRYRFVEKPIWEKLKHGLDYIPPIYRRAGEKNAPLPYSNVVRDVRVVQKSKDYHPALINDNQYTFLHEIRVYDYQEEFASLLVKNYQSFPEIYLLNLLNVCQKVTGAKKTELVKFYQFLFDPMLRHLKMCLVSRSGELSFVKSNVLVYVVHQERDFRLAQKSDLPILCFYGRRIEPNLHGLNGRLLNLKEERLRTSGVEDFTGEYRQLIEKRIFYILTELTERKLAESPYFENPERIRDLSERLAQLKFKKVDSMDRELSSEYFETPILDERVFDVENDCLYMHRNLSRGSQAEGIARALFRNHQFAQTIELVLFRREEPELEKQAQNYNGVEMYIFQKYWIPGFSEKFIQFTKKIVKLFGVPYPAGDPYWYRYTQSHQSKLIEQASQNKRLGELKELVAQLRQRFEHGMFATFQLDIDEELYDPAIARLQMTLSTLPDETAKPFKRRLQALIGKLGIGQKLSELESEMKAAFPDAFARPVSVTVLQAQTAQVALDGKIENIYQSIITLKEKSQQHFSPGNGQIANQLPVKTKKVIFQGATLPGSSDRSEATGAGGEVDVLNLMIAHFLTLVKAERKRALKAVHELILSKSKNDSATVAKNVGYYKACQKQLDDDEALTKALIPFFYVTLHYKYAFVDLFAWYNGRPMMVEVKSTASAGKHDFGISGAEVNEALQTTDYMLVRVTPNEIIFLGNPIYQVKAQFSQVSGGNFEMVPTAFNFKYKHD